MAYRLLNQLIKMNRKTKEELFNMADVYYAAGRLTDEEYTEVIGRISAMEN